MNQETPTMASRLHAWAATRLHRARSAAADDDRGSTTTETVIIAAGLAGLALAVMGAIELFVDGQGAIFGL